MAHQDPPHSAPNRDTSALMRCYVCGSRFSIFKLKHTCQLCLKRVCSKCSSKKKLGDESSARRICQPCDEEINGDKPVPEDINPTIQDRLISRGDPSPTVGDHPNETPKFNRSMSDMDQALELKRQLTMKIQRSKSTIQRANTITMKSIAPQHVKRRMTARDLGIEPSKHAAILIIHVIEGRGLLACDTNLIGQRTSSDPYCVIEIAGEKYKSKTRVVATTLSPVWDEQYKIYLKFPDPLLTITVMDKDLTSRDDFMGSVTIDFSCIPSNKRFSGWLPISNKDVPQAGMLRVSFSIYYDDFSTCFGFIRWRRYLNEGDVMGDPVFNIDELYGPSMLIMDILYWRTVWPMLDALFAVMYWYDWKLSIGVLFLLWPLTHFLQYWPSLICFVIAIKMYTNPVKRAMIPSLGVLADTISDSKNDDGPNNNMTLGSFVVRVTRFMPLWLKQTLALLQYPTRLGADSLMLIYDLVHWRSTASILFFQGLIGLGVAMLFLPFSWFVYGGLAGIVLLYSPILATIVGFADFWFHPVRDAKGVVLMEHFDNRFLSQDAKKFQERNLWRIG